MAKVHEATPPCQQSAPMRLEQNRPLPKGPAVVRKENASLLTGGAAGRQGSRQGLDNTGNFPRSSSRPSRELP